MRRVTAILSVAAVVLMAAGLVAQAKPSFAGEWFVPSSMRYSGPAHRPASPVGAPLLAQFAQKLFNGANVAKRRIGASVDPVAG